MDVAELGFQGSEFFNESLTNLFIDQWHVALL